MTKDSAAHDHTVTAMPPDTRSAECATMIDSVDLELDEGLAVITINRPHACNAIAPDTMEQLEKALDAAEGARTLVIKGAGERAFISGGDLKKLSAIRTVEEASAMAWRMRSICDRLENFPAPVVAALNGHAFGGGAEVAVAADIRLAAEDIKIAFNQVALQIIPPWGGTERLTALLGKSKALLLAGTGTALEAAEAERIGLVDRVLPRASFDEDWRSIAKALASHPASEIKRIVGGASPAEAVAAFARLWVADAHWQEAERVINRIGGSHLKSIHQKVRLEAATPRKSTSSMGHRSLSQPSRAAGRSPAHGDLASPS